MQTAKSCAIIRHIFVLSLLIFLGLAAPVYWQGTKADSATTTEGLPSLRGEEAITHLKGRGHYSSLRGAVKASRNSAAPLTTSIDPLLTQLVRLTAGDGAKEDYFGVAVAISGATAISPSRMKIAARV
jgi:FG-GAP repeat